MLILGSLIPHEVLPCGSTRVALKIANRDLLSVEFLVLDLDVLNHSTLVGVRFVAVR